MRSFDVSSQSIWIEEQDLAQSELRLKGFANISILDSDAQPRMAQLGSVERNDRRPIVHWLSDSGAKKATLIVAEDGELNRYEGLLETHSYAHGTMVQIERIGYARVIDEVTLIFTHS